MTNRAQLRQAINSLIEATHSISEITGVPVGTLVVAMLAAAKRVDADALIEAATSFAPLRMPPESKQGESLIPTSAAYEHMLTLIERDNPQLYRKLTGLD
jgi:hypothetical protein